MSYRDYAKINGPSANRVRKKIAPIPGEGPRGYLRRVARIFHYTDPEWLLELAGLAYKDLDLKENAELLAYTLRLTIREWSIVAYTRIEAHAKVTLHGTLIGSDFVQYVKPKVCIHCVRGQFVERSLWDIALVTSCPAHGCLLVDSCMACGAHFSGTRAEFLLCACGKDVRQFAPQRADQKQLLVSALIEDAFGTSHLADRFVKLLKLPRAIQTLALSDLLDIIQFLGLSEHEGKLLERRASFKGNDLNAMQECCANAVSILTNWPASFSQILQLTAANRRGEKKQGSVKQVFFSFYKTLFETFLGEQFRFLQKAFADFVIDEWKGPIRRNRILLRFAEQDQLKWCGIVQARRLLHCRHPERLVLEKKVRGFVHVGKGGSRRWCFERKSLLEFRSQEIASEVDWISFGELLDLLDAPVKVLHDMAEVGLIARKMAARHHYRYYRSDALRIIEALAINNPPIQKQERMGHITLREARKRSIVPHDGFVPIARAVIKGALSPVARTRTRARLMDYVFSEKDLIRTANKGLNRSIKCMNVKQAAQFLKAHSQKISALLDEGILIPLRRDRQGINIPSSQVRDFGHKFVSLESVAAMAKKSCLTVIAEAKRRSVALFQVGGWNAFVPKKSVAKLVRRGRNES